MSAPEWSRYLADYHHANPGITEVALGHASHPRVGSAYTWLANAIPRQRHSGSGRQQSSDIMRERVLDIGCGSAPMQDVLPDARYLGVDGSQAELLAATALGRGPVVSADATQLPLRDACVDVAVMSMSLMLLPVPASLAETQRVLRHGGLFAATVPALWPLSLADARTLLALSLPLRGPGAMPQQLGARRLTRALTAAGFGNIVMDRKRFEFPLRSDADADLAVRSLYTPGRTEQQLATAREKLRALAGQSALPIPLLRVVATKR
ncbi:MAG: class I SAM-dependent methyltransferase [Actinomycetia bacterium]|nr:class I SAM-dependent methyltransferase [Actinomycetes bacterium]